MRTQSAFIIWTAMVLHLSIINGQRTDSSLDVRSPPNEIILKSGTTSLSDYLESRPSTAIPNVSSTRTDFSSDEVTPTVSPPSQSPSSPRDDTTLNTDSASAPGSSASSLTVSYLKSTVSDSVVTAAPTAPTTSVSPRESNQTISTSPNDESQTTQTAPSSTPTHPQTSQFVLTSSSKVTGPAPLEDQEEASELDVGDQESGKAPHHPASPLDPLLAALVTIFIICTAMVSAVLFLRFRQRSEHPEFHRLQDLPMDDLLEDTPLSRYNY